MGNQEKIWDKLYSQRLTWKRASRGLTGLKNKSVLELGVGTGKTLKSIIDLNPKKITAIDLSEEAIKTLKNQEVQLVKSDFLKYKTKEKFEVIVCHYFLNNFDEKNRIRVVRKMKSLLEEKGTILFEDFGKMDFRNIGEKIEKNTVRKKNGIICHFFDKPEMNELFKDFDIKIKEKKFNPIRSSKRIKRHIINATIKSRNNAPGRI